MFFILILKVFQNSIIFLTFKKDRPKAKEVLETISKKYYKYHLASDILEEFIEDWKGRVRQATKLNFENNILDIQLKDIKGNGEIALKEGIFDNIRW